ncbi:O-antigen ligase family protein [Sphingomonas sp. AX6]|uniref:O-antigen ligase family protein n=1 Tax=Sphingomonas sp. AX6 TaxID=2653171 RepID=UPI0012EF1958|nr:O-antigen ligase family protein [Sphingomonas sp. AX6]VXC47866.1 conserved membrane hypothetical protein [Sphingomonas sp. AX6]
MSQSLLRQRFARSGAVTFWSVVAFLVAVALAGGASNPSSFAQVLVRATATLAAAGWLVFAMRSGGDPRLRPAFVFIGLCAVLIGVQLVPLPPSWWAALPARDAYAVAAAAVGVDGQWRPISVAPDLGWSAFFGLIVPVALLVGLACLSPRKRADLMLPLAVLIFASGVLGLAQLSGGDGSALRWYAFTSESSAVGFLANRNHQALLLACALPVLAALASMPPKAGVKQRSGWVAIHWVALGTGAFIVLMLPSTGSRAGLALGGLSILAALAIAAPAMRQRLMAMRRKKRRLFVGGGVAAALAFVAVLVFLGQNVAFSRIAGLDPMSDQRIRAFPVVFDMTRDFLPFGSGIGTFDRVFRQYEPFELLQRPYFNEAHNDIVQLVLEGGIAAGLLLVAFAIWWMIATVRAWRAPVSAQSLAARAGSVITLLCLLASIVDYPLRTPLMLAIFALAAAWMLTPVSPRRDAGD